MPLGTTNTSNERGHHPFAADDEEHSAPRMLFVDQSGQLGGAEFALLPLAASQRAKSEVVLLSDGPFRTSLEAQGTRVKLITHSRVSKLARRGAGIQLLRAIPGMIGQIRALAREARRFDVLFLNTQKALVLGAIGKPLHRRPVIWYLHDILSRDHFGKLQLAIVKWLVRSSVDRVIANSRASAESLCALTGWRMEDVPIVYNGIDASQFENCEESMDALRMRLGLPRDAWLAGLFGRLAAWKGQHIALEALAKTPDMHLVLVGAPLFGEDAYAAQLHRQAAELGVTDRVHFAGFQHDVPAWMRAMDAILHTSTEPEPFGRVIVEGMAAGKPVIASAAGGVMEIVTDRVNGLLVQPGSPMALADAIRTLRDDPTLAAKLANQAVRDARSTFSIRRFLQNMTRAIREMPRD